MFGLTLQFLIVVILVLMIKYIHEMITFNEKASLIELTNPSPTKINHESKNKSPIVTNTDSLTAFTMSIDELKHKIPGYMIHENQTIISLDNLCESDKICIHKNQPIIDDYKLNTKYDELFSPYSTYLDKADYYLSIYRGNTIVELTKNLRNTTIFKPLEGNIVVYIFNPKHEKDIKGLEPKSIKKWGIKIELDTQKTLYIPPEWYYFYELKDDVVLAQIESDNYFTFLYNFIRRN